MRVPAISLPARLALFLPVLLLMLLARTPAEGASTGPDVSTDGIFSSEELIERPAHFDGVRVTIRGEVVGEILRRRNSAWLLVNDDIYSSKPLHVYQLMAGGNSGISVHCEEWMIKDIEYVGSYRYTGDTVEVRGTFYRSNPEYGGDLMIEAEQVTVVRRGFPIPQRGIRKTTVLAAALGVLALILGFLLWKKDRMWARASS